MWHTEGLQVGSCRQGPHLLHCTADRHAPDYGRAGRPCEGVLACTQAALMRSRKLCARTSLGRPHGGPANPSRGGGGD